MQDENSQEKISVVHIGGSIEKALKGDYIIDVKAVLAEAWQYTLRARVSINLGIAFSLFLGTLISLIVSSYLGGIEAVLNDPKASMILNIIVTIAIWPFMAGVEMMGVFHAVGLKTHPKLIFSFLKRGSWVALSALLTSLLMSIGFQLFILPGIFLVVVLSLTIPLVVDKQMMPMKAIILSIQTLRFKWFQIFLLYIILMFALVLLFVPLIMFVESSLSPIAIVIFILGFSFLAPLYYNVKGILYREIFGVNLKADANLNTFNRSNSNDSDNNDTFSA